MPRLVLRDRGGRPCEKLTYPKGSEEGVFRFKVIDFSREPSSRPLPHFRPTRPESMTPPVILVPRERARTRSRNAIRRFFLRVSRRSTFRAPKACSTITSTGKICSPKICTILFREVIQSTERNVDCPIICFSPRRRDALQIHDWEIFLLKYRSSRLHRRAR